MRRGVGVVGGVAAALIALFGGGAAAGARNGVTGLLVAPSHSHGRLDTTLVQIADAQNAKGTAGAIAKAQALDVAVRQNRVAVIVTAQPNETAMVISAIADAGGSVEATEGVTVSAAIPPGRLEKLAASPSVAAVREPSRPFAETVDEGVAATGADTVQSGGTNGIGVKVAVIDLGFTDLTNVFTGSPSWLATTQNFGCTATPGGPPNADGGTAHGTAVVEIVHQMAPGATIVPICVNDNVDLWDAEQWAVNNGVKIINHSVGWYGTSRGDGTGGAFTPDAAAADARSHGILWVNAAGNDAQDHWSGTFAPYGPNPAFNDFGGGDPTDSITIAGGATACVILTWDAWPVTSEDYDWGLVRQSDGALVQVSANDQAGDPNSGGAALDAPVEDNCFQNTGSTQSFDLEILKYSAQASAHFDLWVLGAASEEYTTTAGSLAQPASSPDTFAVGAECWQSGATESFSSRGPTIDGRQKPDIEGPDSTSSSVFGTFSACPSAFAGTSAAAPHVAGAAALLLQQTPSLGVAALEARLQEQAAAHSGLDGAQSNDVGTGKLWIGSIANPGRIIAASANNGANGIYSMNADGSGVEQLAAGTGVDPALSPNGAKIAFSVNGAIKVMNAADGSNVTTIADPGLNGFYRSPSWSPDGTKLAWGTGGGVDLKNADGTGSITGVSISGRNIDVPVWIDNTTLAVVASGTFNTEIWRVNTNGTSPIDLTPSITNVATRERSLAVSPDGTKIAFAAGDPGTQIYQLYTMNVDGSNQTAITSGTLLGRHFDPTWSPDGTKILFSDEFGNGDGGGLYTINADGSGSETLIRKATIVGNSAWVDPNWTSGANSPAWSGGLPRIVASSPQVGVGLEATPGRWDGPRPITFGFAWSRCDGSGNACVPIAGATDDTYVPTSADVDSTLRVNVTGTNAKGSASAMSSASPAVQPATTFATAVPTIAGSAQERQSLGVASAGTWTTASQFSYQWLRCDTDGASCFAATAVMPSPQSYTLTSADVGHRIRLSVQAGTNGRWATSLATPIVTAAPTAPPPPSGGGGGGGGGGGLAGDLSVDGSVSSPTAVQGDPLVWTFHVVDTNKGPAVDVHLDLTLSANLTYVSSTTTRGPGCSQSGGKVHCFLDWMSGDVPSATISVTTTVASSGDYSIIGTVGQLIPDSNTANNTTTVKASAPPPPPPPPPTTPVRPVIGAPTATPAAPVAGKRFVVGFSVKRSDNGRPLIGARVVIVTSVGGAAVAHKVSFAANGRAILSLLVPRRAKGRLLSLKITVAFGGRSAVRRVTYRIR